LPRTPDGEVPVVYRADLNNPATFLVAQNFPVRDGDVIYVANAPAVELQKFLNILASTVYTAVLTRAVIQ
jgi:polysaccharide export outer membrane protein